VSLQDPEIAHLGYFRVIFVVLFSGRELVIAVAYSVYKEIGRCKGEK
jgi:hypothetical protein